MPFYHFFWYSVRLCEPYTKKVVLAKNKQVLKTTKKHPIDPLHHQGGIHHGKKTKTQFKKKTKTLKPKRVLGLGVPPTPNTQKTKYHIDPLRKTEAFTKQMRNNVLRVFWRNPRKLAVSVLTFLGEGTTGVC